MSQCQYWTYNDLTSLCLAGKRMNKALFDIVHEDDENSYMIDSLLQAADEGNFNELVDLLKGNQQIINVNSHNKHLETALHFSSSSGHLDVVKYLISNGAEIDCKDKHLETPLYWAARQGNGHIVEYLVKEGSYIDSPNESGQTALVAAVKYGRLDMVKLLCNLHANINYTDEQGETVAHCVSWLDLEAEVYDVIFSLPSLYLDVKNNNHETALHISAGRGNITCLEALIRHGADVNCLDKRGSTPLHLACHCQHLLVVKQLLTNNKLNINLVDQNGDTSLHVVCQSGLLKLVQLLCWHRCNVDAVNKMGKTALHIAANLGHTEIVRCLLLHGAALNYSFKNNVTAHMMAMAKGKNDTAELLSKLTPEKQQAYRRQLMRGSGKMERVKMKVFGCSGVGKTKLIQALGVGFFGKYFKRKSYETSPLPNKSFSTPPSSSSSSISSIPSIVNHEVHFKKDIRHLDLDKSFTCLSPSHSCYTKGIQVTNSNISNGVGELSVWEFSGYENYYPLYDKFIGDVNCIHMVCFDLLQTPILQTPPTTPLQSPTASNNSLNFMNPIRQFKKINFWLNFLKSRLPASEPIAKEGQLHTKAKVVLVGIANGLSKAQLAALEGSELKKRLHELYMCMKSVYWMDLEIHPLIFLVDSAQTYSLTPLKTCLAQLKKMICHNLPLGSGFSDSTIVSLPYWRKILSGYPVVTWQNFIEYVRNTSNLLCGHEHLKELIYKLQIMGEVVFVETKEGEDDLVVLDVNWLCGELLGSLLSYEMISTCKKSGFYSNEDFHFLFPDFEISEVLHLLEALGLCNRCEIKGKDSNSIFEEGKLKLKKKSLSVLELNSLQSKDVNDFGCEYEIPCLNFTLKNKLVWEEYSSENAKNFVYAGSRYILECQYCHSNVEKSLQLRKKNYLINDFDFQPISPPSPVNCDNHKNGVLLEKESNCQESPKTKTFQKTKNFGIIHPILPPYLISPLTEGSNSVLDEDFNTAYNQLGQIFSKIQFEMRKRELEKNSFDKLELSYHAFKLAKEDIEVLVILEEGCCECCNNEETSSKNLSSQSFRSICKSANNLCYCCTSYIEIKCRGPTNASKELFEIMKKTRFLVENTISMCCPSLDVYHQILSATQLAEHKKNVQSFSQRQILEAYQHSGVDAIICYEGENDEENVESLTDLLAFGNPELFDTITLAIDLPLNALDLQTRRTLAFLLDPSDQKGCDWCMLAIVLGLSNQIPQFDSASANQFPISKTDRIFQLLNELKKTVNKNKEHEDTQSQTKNFTIGNLIDKLKGLGRNDAVDVIYKMCPLTYRSDDEDTEDEVDYDDEIADDNGDFFRQYNNISANNNDENIKSFKSKTFFKNSNEENYHYNIEGGFFEMQKDDASNNSDDPPLEEDMYFDDNYDVFEGQGVFDDDDPFKLEKDAPDGFYTKMSNYQ